MSSVQRLHDARGAVLIHVTVALVAMTALSALAVDLGVAYVGRRQTQNAADAAALAAASARAFVDYNSAPLAQQSALAAARANLVWGEQPDIDAADVTFPACPPGTPGVAGSCVRADVFRTSYGRSGGSPLPTFFAGLIGVQEQGARASAVAQMRAGAGTSDCVKPWALADRWFEAPGGDPADQFNRYLDTLPLTLLPDPDSYHPRDGWALPDHYGTRLQLYVGGPTQPIGHGFIAPIQVHGGGPTSYEESVTSCAPTSVEPDQWYDQETATIPGASGHGFEALIAFDPAASWDPTAHGGRGAVVGGCMADASCSRSPRWVAVPVFDPDEFVRDRLQLGPASARIHVVRIAGLWIDEVTVSGEVYGYVTHYPTLFITNLDTPSNQSFARTVILVR